MGGGGRKAFLGIQRTVSVYPCNTKENSQEAVWPHRRPTQVLTPDMMGPQASRPQIIYPHQNPCARLLRRSELEVSEVSLVGRGAMAPGSSGVGTGLSAARDAPHLAPSGGEC